MIFRWPILLLFGLSIPLSLVGAFESRILDLIWVWNAFVFVLAVAAWMLTPRANALVVCRQMDKVLSVRADNPIKLAITNKGAVPINLLIREEAPGDFWVEKREFRFKLESGQTRDVTYYVRPRRRGDYFFRDSFVRILSPFGLVYRQETVLTREVVRVYPNVLALREFDLLKQKGHLRQIGIRRARLRGVGTEFESLRDYTRDDEYRRIDWKATARTNKFIVRDFEAEKNQPVILAVDFGRLMLAEAESVEKLDYVLDAALMLANAVSNANDQLGLLVYGDQVERWIPPGRGKKQVGNVIEALHALVAEPISSASADAFSYLAARWKRRSLLIIFSELQDPEEARQLARVLGPLTKRHVVLVVTVRDPGLRAQLEAPLSTITGMYLRTAASQFNEDRITAQRLLNEHGIRALDCEPKELAAALVNYYMDTKATIQL
jgi:uncharacterized protein (DUF58 family)